MLESTYQGQLIKKIKLLLDGCLILKNDSGYIQGIPDLLILYKDRWATLEVKKDATAKVQPNQPFYVDLMNRMSYSAFIFPENEEEVLRELQAALQFGRKARVSRAQ